MVEKSADEAATKKATTRKAPASKKATEKKAAPARKTPAKPAPAAKKAPPKKTAPAESSEDSMKRKFREALEHKQGTSGAQARGHDSGHGPALANNDKRTQMFRRKSGG